MVNRGEAWGEVERGGEKGKSEGKIKERALVSLTFAQLKQIH